MYIFISIDLKFTSLIVLKINLILCYMSLPVHSEAFLAVFEYNCWFVQLRTAISW